MIKTVRLLLEYKQILVWLYDEDDMVIDTALPPEWENDADLVTLIDDISGLYDSFFVDNPREFYWKGCPDEQTRECFKSMVTRAVNTITFKNNGKYIIRNDTDKYLNDL